MADETTDTTAPTTTVAATTEQPATPPAGTQAPPVAAQEATFTQADVNRIAAAAREEGRKAAAAKPAAPAAPAPKPAPTAGAALTADQVQQILVRDRVFTRAITTAALTDRQSDRMEAALQAANPQDVSAWCQEYLEDMGLKKQPAPTPATPAASTATTAEAPKPAAAPSAPSGASLPTSNGVIDVFQPGVAAQLGPQGLRVELEKLWGLADSIKGKPQRPSLPSQRK